MFDYVLNTSLSLVVTEVWVDEEPISLIRMKNKRVKAVLNGTDVVNVCKFGGMDKDVDYLRCHEVEAVEDLDMRYDDMNAVTQRV